MTLREDCQEKLDAALHHYEDMQANLADPQAFRRSLAAFLSAIRSPLQYIHGTADPNAGRQPPPNPRLPVNAAMMTWYQNRMNGNQVLRFFKDERDLDIHQRPVRPMARVTVRAEERMTMVDEARIIVENVVTGQTEIHEIPAGGRPPQATSETPEPVETTWEYQFPQWTATPDNDVMRLCQQCLTEVENVISDGIARGHIV